MKSGLQLREGPATTSNRVLDLLPRKERARILMLAKQVDLPLSQELYEVGEKVRYVYFPSTGVISLVAVIEGSPGVELALLGREGMLGVEVLLGNSVSPLRALVQASGSAWRIERHKFELTLADSPVLRHCMQQYLSLLVRQLVTSAACLRFHLIGPRLARFLLLMQDRVCSDELIITQEFLALMLGVRRVGISAAAAALQQCGLIRYQRGQVRILDRSGLEAAACHCCISDRLAMIRDFQ